MNKIREEIGYVILEKISEDYKVSGRNLKKYYYIMQTPYGMCKVSCSHWQHGKTPSIQSALDKNDYFKNRANEVHDFGFEYLEDYVNNSTKMNMKCKKANHIFKQTPNSHLNGQGCRQCYDLFKNGTDKNGYTKTNFFDICMKNNNGFRCFLYY